MADTKTSALTAVVTPAVTDEFYVNQGSVSKKVTLDTLASFASAPIFACQQADYTLTSSTTAQKLFNISTNGAVTVPIGLYWLEAHIILTTMSATSGNGVFSLAGTAVLGTRMLSAYGLDATTPATGAAIGGAFIQAASAFTTNTVTAGVGTSMGLCVRGIVGVTTAGTIIPSIALTTANAAVVKTGSSFTMERMAAATDTTRGTWS